MPTTPDVIHLLAPVSGLMTPLQEVPDQVFAEKMAGDGVSIDPFDEILVAPSDGTVTLIHPSNHAVVITTSSGLEVLLHIGLDTVMLRGEGFTVQVSQGQTVTAGQPLIEFDSTLIAEKSASLLTQMVISNLDPSSNLLAAEGIVKAGLDTALTVRSATSHTDSPLTAARHGASAVSEEILVLNPSGYHARPASVLAAKAKAYPGEIQLHKDDQSANAKSVTSILSLNVQHGDHVRVEIVGPESEEALKELVEAIRAGLGEETNELSNSPQNSTPYAEPETPIDPNRIVGIGASPGVAIGRIARLEISDITVDATPSADLGAEWQALDHAIEEARVELAALEKKVSFEAGEIRAEIFGAHREMLDDPELLSSVDEAISSGSRAAYAWKHAYTTQAESLETLNNELLRQRATDIRDVGMRVLKKLTNYEDQPVDLPEQAIVIARDLTPSQTASLDRSKVMGFATVEGGATSHAAILAQSLGIPAVTGAESRLLDIPEGTQVVIDGQTGCVVLNLTEAELTNIRELQEKSRIQKDENQRHALDPAKTRDGHSVEVVANIGSVSDAQDALANGAEGVGLLRSEFAFMDRTTAPTEAEQASLYQQMASVFSPGQRLVVRTLDIGGDKPLPYMPMRPEENPFLGLRGIRIGLNQPAILRPQIRAILTAASDGADIHIMFPMISTIDEFRKARLIVEEERVSLGAPEVPVGLMVEVPAVAMLSDRFAAEADFLSIGTNDLTQYALAMDRGHPALASLVDSLNPGVLALIKHTVDGAHRHGKWVGVCGGLASDPHAAPLLVGLGVDELSTVIPAIPSVKAAIRQHSLADCQKLANKALAMRTAAEVRKLITPSPSV